MKERLFELVIKDETDEVFAISLVSDPAIERDFLYFGKEEIKLTIVDDEKHMLIGPIMLADMKILRVDAENNPYFVFFSKDTVKKLAQNYLKKGYQSNTTFQHEKDIKDVTLVESWIVEDKRMDKSSLYKLELPVGSWCGVFKIDNTDIWDNYIKTGELQGFSVEGMFEHKPVNQSKDVMELNVDELSDDELKLVIEKIIETLNEK